MQSGFYSAAIRSRHPGFATTMASDQTHTAPRHGIAGRMAAYIEAARNERVREPAREAALKCIFDLLGAAAAGLDDAGPLVEPVETPAPQAGASVAGVSIRRLRVRKLTRAATRPGTGIPAFASSGRAVLKS